MNIRHILMTVAALALAACGGGDDGGTTSAGTSGSTTTAASSVAPDFPNLKACVTNNWFMSADQLLRGLQALGGSGVNFTSATGGQTAVFSADGTYRNTYADFTVNFTGGSSSGTSKYAGIAAGTWDVDGDRLIMTQTSSTATVTTTIAGVSSTTPVPASGTTSSLKVISCMPATLTYDQTFSTGAVARIVLVIG